MNQQHENITQAEDIWEEFERMDNKQQLSNSVTELGVQVSIQNKTKKENTHKTKQNRVNNKK
jgi:hypothetical protein